MKRFFAVILITFGVFITADAQTKKKTTPKSKSKTSVKASTAKQSEEKKKAEELKIQLSLFRREELEAQRNDALKEIELTSQLLSETKANAANSLNRLNLLVQQLTARKRVVALLEQEVVTIDLKVKSMNNEIKVLENDLEKIKENYAKSMQSRQQEHRTTQYKMLLILSAENLSQSYRRMRYLKEYSGWQKEEADRIIIKQNDINKRKAELEQTRTEKLTLIAQRADESKKIEEEEAMQQKEVQQLSRKQKDLQSELQKKQRNAEDLNSQIEKLITEDIADSGKNASPATAKTKKDVAETKTETPPPPVPPSEYVMTASESNLSKDFANNKGRLPYPVAGKHTIVSSFGEHQHQELSHVRTNNNGIDIQTTAGTDACAIFKGVVTRIFVMPGFNYNVIIRHGDYLTVYSNISQVYVKAGDIVDTRQAVGKVYTDAARGNETILHFQIWKERTKLNPALWIK
jgi:septal ring factor EnvC (AmiA/AmiB activator)